MSDQEAGRDKKLDEILDAALAEYSQVEPRPGLDNRILAGLASDQQRAWRWDWKWVLAFAAACIVIALLVAPHEKKDLVEIGSKTSEESITGNANSSAVSIGAREVQPKRNVESGLHPGQLVSRQHAQPRAAVPQGNPPQQPVVKQPVFPAPSPLSEQEKLLFAYLRRTPYQELVQNSKPDEPKAENEINQVTPEQEKSLNRDSNSR